MEDQLKKANDENQKLSKEVLELNNSILKFKKGMTPSSSHINFIKAHDFMASTSKNETQTFKGKRSHVSNNKGRSHKTQHSLTQRGKAQTKVPQSGHAYMYTRHNHNRLATQHNAHKHVAQTYQNYTLSFSMYVSQYGSKEL